VDFTFSSEIADVGVDAPVARVSLNLLDIGMNDPDNVGNESFERIASTRGASESRFKEPEVDVAGAHHSNLI
jgi:hypothetical protein